MSLPTLVNDQASNRWHIDVSRESLQQYWSKSHHPPPEGRTIQD